MLRTLKRVVTGRRGDGVFRECRHCGTTVSRRASGCPACGSREVAVYEL